MALKKAVAAKPSTCHVTVKQKLSALCDEMTGLVSKIDEDEVLRLRNLVYDAYDQCKGADTDGKYEKYTHNPNGLGFWVSIKLIR